MGLRVFMDIKALNMVVEVGLVTGVTPTITPTGSATLYISFQFIFINNAHGLFILYAVVDMHRGKRGSLRSYLLVLGHPF